MRFFFKINIKNFQNFLPVFGNQICLFSEIKLLAKKSEFHHRFTVGIFPSPTTPNNEICRRRGHFETKQNKLNSLTESRKKFRTED